MPIMTLVVPQLKTDGMRWRLEGRATARQCLIERGLLPVLAAPSPSGVLADSALQSPCCCCHRAGRALGQQCLAEHGVLLACTGTLCSSNPSDLLIPAEGCSCHGTSDA